MLLYSTMTFGQRDILVDGTLNIMHTLQSQGATSQHLDTVRSLLAYRFRF